VKPRYMLVIGILVGTAVFGAVLFGVVGSMTFTPPRSFEWQEAGVNNVSVFLPKGDASVTITGGEPILFEWYMDGNRFRLEGTEVFWNNASYGHCKPNGTVRVYPGGEVEIDGAIRKPSE